MPQSNAKQTASWVRVRLMTPKDGDCQALTEGELVLRADRVAVDEEHLNFLLAGEVVFRLDRRYFRALTWFVDRPTFGEWLKARRAQYPNSHKPWSEADTVRLAAAVARGVDWPKIALMLGRTASACQRQAALSKRAALNYPEGQS